MAPKPGTGLPDFEFAGHVIATGGEMPQEPTQDKTKY